MTSDIPSPDTPNPDFEGFLAELNNRESVGEEIETYRLKFRTFLEDRGEEFSQDEVNAQPPLTIEEEQEQDRIDFEQRFVRRLEELEAQGIVIDDGVAKSVAEEVGEEQIEAYRVGQERQTQLAIKEIELNFLATQKSMLSALQEHEAIDPSELSELKKDLQTNLLAKGFSRAWLELVDVEFPGEPLTAEEEIDRVAAVLRDSAEYSRKFKLESRRLKDEMQAFWEAHSGEFLSITALPTVSALAVRKLLSQTRKDKGLGTSNGVEDARTLLIEKGLTGPSWSALVDRFFNEARPDQD